MRGKLRYFTVSDWNITIGSTGRISTQQSVMYWIRVMWKIIGFWAVRILKCIKSKSCTFSINFMSLGVFSFYVRNSISNFHFMVESVEKASTRHKLIFHGKLIKVLRHLISSHKYNISCWAYGYDNISFVFIWVFLWERNISDNGVIFLYAGWIN